MDRGSNRSPGGGRLAVTGVVSPSGKLCRVGGLHGKLLFAALPKKVIVIPHDNLEEAQAIMAADSRLQALVMIPAHNIFESAFIAYTLDGIRKCKWQVFFPFVRAGPFARRCLYLSSL